MALRSYYSPPSEKQVRIEDLALLEHLPAPIRQELQHAARWWSSADVLEVYRNLVRSGAPAEEASRMICRAIRELEHESCATEATCHGRAQAAVLRYLPIRPQRVPPFLRAAHRNRATPRLRPRGRV